MKKIQIEIEVTYEVGDEVHYMNGRGIPQAGKVVGYIIDTVEGSINYLVERFSNKVLDYHVNDLYDSREALLKKRKIIAPAAARDLLAKHKIKPIWFIDSDAKQFLEERAALVKQGYAAKKLKDANEFLAKAGVPKFPK